MPLAAAKVESKRNGRRDWVGRITMQDVRAGRVGLRETWRQKQRAGVAARFQVG